MTEAYVSWHVTGKEKFHKAVFKIYATGFRIFHSILLFQKKKRSWGLPWWSKWQRLHAPNAGGLGSIPGQTTRSHTRQLKIPHVVKKTRLSQTNKQKKDPDHIHRLLSLLSWSTSESRTTVWELNLYHFLGLHSSLTSDICCTDIYLTIWTMSPSSPHCIYS